MINEEVFGGGAFVCVCVCVRARVCDLSLGSGSTLGLASMQLGVWAKARAGTR